MSSNPHIVQAIERLGRGGAERHVVDLASSLPARDWNVTVLSKGGALESIVDDHVLTTPSRFRTGGWYRSLTEINARRRIDIVHVHSLAPLPGACIFRARTGVPVVFSAHSGWYQQRQRWLPPLLAVTPISAVVAVSEQAADALRFTRSSAAVVHNGVPDRNGAGAVAENVDPGNARLVAIGSLLPVKNHALLIQAMVEIVSRYPGCHLSILGEGPLRAELQRQIDESGLAGNVDLLGFRDPHPYLATATSLVSASSSEGLSIAQLEALMWGRPLVVVPGGGGAAALVTSQNGAIARAADPNSLAKAILQVLHEDQTVMGQASRRIYQERYRHDQMVTNLVAIYARLAELGAS